MPKSQLLGLRLHLMQGYGTRELQEKFGLRKTSQNDKKTFSSHAVDAWAMAASVSGAKTPSWKRLLYWVLIRLHWRQLHRLKPDAGGIRWPYGGTRSMGLSRGTLVRHVKYGLTYIGGTLKGRATLHSIVTGKRLTQGARLEEIVILTGLSWLGTLISVSSTPKSRWEPRIEIRDSLNAGVSAAHAPRRTL